MTTKKDTSLSWQVWAGIYILACCFSFLGLFTHSDQHDSLTWQLANGFLYVCLFPVSLLSLFRLGDIVFSTFLGQVILIVGVFTLPILNGYFIVKFLDKLYHRLKKKVQQ